MISNNEVVDAQVAGDFEACRLGSWINSEQGLTGRSGFQAIQLAHADFHALAQNAVTAMNTGRKEEVAQFHRQMHVLSGQLVELLIKGSRLALNRGVAQQVLVQV
ncbi:MAG: hypothetical protein APF81_11080 [Desulfosporosinus sp. BRH_c37]|nr:MAG: hypothetical protein APF81_11080 [Desulfosporosinus sp. BRH_c37]